ncbi:unnamed protein product, partial [Clonostachys rosea f. rosea IK726]
SDLTQTLTATRILPYSRDPLYSLIADVDDYSSFVPYCSRSRVTHWTEVHLSIKYQFVNPLYAAVSAAVSDKVAGMMIEAFEKQARQKLGSQAPL